MIVDCHTHIFEAGRGGPFNLPCSADDLVREMDAHGVDVSVVLPLPGVASNEFVQRECARHPKRLTPLYNPEFDATNETLQKMEAFFGSYAPKGLKIHPRNQGVSVNDSVVLEVLHWAAEKALPVLFDVFPWGESLDNLALHPLAYHQVAQKFPNLKLILAHAGGYKLMEGFMVAKSNANVFLDISFTPLYFHQSSLAADCAFLCRRLPVSRVLYGSDFPSVRFSESLDAARQLLASASAEITDETMGKAAARVFGLTQG
jgi:predicted TIM-barrel fold metal-dependent hydrolase